MTHVYRLEDVPHLRPSLVTIGVFDGVHVGHQALLTRLVAQARTMGYQSAVVTFFPHPDALLHGVKGRYYLTSPEQRAMLIRQAGVDVVVTHPFDEIVRQQRAHEFVEKLVKYLNLKHLWVGRDFALGYQREGNLDFLSNFGQEKGYSVEAIELVMAGSSSQVISSTAIRQNVLEGNMEAVSAWLGRGYELVGQVVYGEQRGRLIGFPTANLSVWDAQLLPKNGVYAGWATVNGSRYMAVTNIGTRPTFNGEGVRVEPHLLAFSGDIYGAELSLTLEKRLRSEQKFSGVEALKAQLEQDVQSGYAFLSGLTD